MKRIWNAIAKDFWIVILDVIAVNAAYLLALLIRFYVNFVFRPTVVHYLTSWLRFTPFYTVLAILIFAVWKLYGGMWRYAGFNDLNRIIGANLCTTAVQILGTLLFVQRMPITYYVLGAMIQFLFVILTRFSFRIFLAEKKMVTERNNPFIPSMVIGAGEAARKTMHYLEDTPFRPTVVVDEKAAGKMLDGIRIVSDFDRSLSSVRAVFIGDPNLPAEKRREIKEKCEAAGIELQDYTGYLSNLGGRVPPSSVLELISGPVTLIIDGKAMQFESGEEAVKSLKERYEIRSIEGAKITLAKPSSGAFVEYDAWAQQHKEQTGEDVSFF